MGIKTNNRGFTLLIAVIFMSVMLSLGLALGSLAYKQEILASSAIQSQYAFYAADSALECALYADQQLPPPQPAPGGPNGPGTNPFGYNNHPYTTSLACGGANTTVSDAAPPGCYDGANGCALGERGTHVQIQLDRDQNGNYTRCADIYVYKTQSQSAGTTFIFSQGYNVSCTTVNTNPSGTRLAARGLEAHY